MAEEKTMRLSLVAKQINIGTSTILQFLSAKGHKVDNNPNAKLNFEQLSLLAAEYGANHLLATDEAPKKPVEEIVVPAPVVEKAPEPVAVVEPAPEPAKVEAPKVAEVAPAPEEEKPMGLKVLGKIDLDKKGNPVPPKPAPKPEPVVEKVPEPVVKPEPVVEVP
ncbi:MAG: hypothetical protein RIQ98_1217, partial [Bacteroidota bacterium]